MKNRPIAIIVLIILGIVTFFSMGFTYHLTLTLMGMAKAKLAIDASMIALLPVVSGFGTTALGGIMMMLTKTDKDDKTPAPVEITNTSDNPVPVEDEGL